MLWKIQYHRSIEVHGFINIHKCPNLIGKYGEILLFVISENLRYCFLKDWRRFHIEDTTKIRNACAYIKKKIISSLVNILTKGKSLACRVKFVIEIFFPSSNEWDETVNMQASCRLTKYLWAQLYLCEIMDILYVI